MVEPSPRAPEEQHIRRVTLIADLSGRVLEITERARELKLAVALEPGVSLFDLLHADDIGPLCANRDWCLAHHGREVSIRVRISRAEEWWIPVVVTVKAVSAISTEYRIELDDAAAARTAERQMRQAVDSSEQGIIVTNGVRVFYINAAFARLQGYDSLQDILGDARVRLHDNIHPDDVSKVRDELAKRVSGEKKFSQYEFRLKRRDDSYVWVECRAALVRWDGQIASLSWLSDISERKRNEADLIKSREAAYRANRSKSEFLAGMSHELRTPLNAIIGFSQLIESHLFGTIDARYADYAGDIRRSGEHLLELINEILDLSKLEAGKHQLREDDIDLGRICLDCLGLMRQGAEEAELSLNDEIARDLPMVHADARALKQVLLNFLSNAVKFTPKGGSITLSAGLEGDFVHLSVRDTGIGMNDAQLKVALEPFGQVQSAHLAREHKGTGLGLPISKGLMQLHGGDIVVESSPNRGTLMTARLPASRIVEAAA
jgi:PAS domain S-box-containing protein